jgi:hypothetical protein
MDANAVPPFRKHQITEELDERGRGTERGRAERDPSAV